MEEKFPELHLNHEAMKELVEVWMLRSLRTGDLEDLNLFGEEVGWSNFARWEKEVLGVAQISSIVDIISKEQLLDLVRKEIGIACSCCCSSQGGRDKPWIYV